LRLAFVSTSYPVGDLPVDGIGKAFSLIAGEASLHHDVSVIVPNPRSECHLTYRDSGVDVHVVPAPETTLSRLLRKMHLVHPAVRVRLASAVREAVYESGPFDILEAPSWFGLHAFVGARRKSRVNKVVTLLVTPVRISMESSSAHFGLGLRLADRFDRFATRRSDALIADSRLHEERLRSIGWIDPNQDVAVIPLPTRLPPLAETRPPVDALEILQVGVLSERKRQDLSLEALKLLREDFPDLKLSFVGSEAEERGTCSKRALQDLSTALGVKASFLSGLSDEELRLCYRRAAVVIQPSEYESFGLPVAEAMGAGRPVVTTATTGAAEWITGVSGTVITEASGASLAAALRPYLSDGARRAIAGRAARIIAEREFDPGRLWEQRLRLYRSLCTEPEGIS
jgi:glycogen synthase